MKGLARMVQAVAWLGLVPGATWAQLENDNWEIVETYPFAASYAVDSDAEDDTVVLATGSGLMTLDGAALQPVPLDPPGSADYRLRCRGFVHDVEVTDDWTWVAAGVGGLQRWARLDNTMNFALDLVHGLDGASSAAWCLDVVHDATSGSDLVVVGSNDDELAGRLFLVRVDSQGVVEPLDWISLGLPVFSVAASLTLNSGYLTILAGTTCNTSVIPVNEPCHSLFRYEVPLSGPGQFEIPQAVASWGLDCAPGVMVRDIILMETATYRRACVAASANGVRLFDLANGGLDEILSGGWPILNPTGSTPPNGEYRYLGLGLYQATGGAPILVAALGPNFAVERQYFGGENFPLACDIEGGADDPTWTGVAVFNLAQNPVNQLDGFLGVAEANPARLPKEPLGLAVRANGTSEFLVDVAVGSHGLSVVRATQQGSGWTLQKQGSWSWENGNYFEKLPGGSFDDVRRFLDPATDDPYLLVTTEARLLSFPEEGSPLFGNFTGHSAGGVLLNRVSHQVLQAPTVAYIYGQTNVVKLFDLASPTGAAQPEPLPVPLVLATTPAETRGYCTLLAPGLEPEADYLWLYVCSNDDTITQRQACPEPCSDPSRNAKNGSVRVFRVSDASGNLITEPDSMTTPEIGTYAPSVCCDEAAEHGSFMDVYAIGRGEGHEVFLSYGPGGDETHGGLMVLKATWNGSAIDWEFKGKLPLNAIQQGSVAGRLTYDADRERLYASYSTHGVAVYDVGTAWAASEVGKYQWPSIEGHGMTSLHVWPGPGNYIYVALMSWGVGILDATSATTLADGFVLGSPFALPGIPDAFEDAPVTDSQLYPPRSAVYVADGRGGVHRVQFKVFSP